jgi:hypothetical protein
MDKSQLPGPTEWRQIIDGQQASGLTVAAYCLERGITQGSFYTWKRRLRQPAKRNRLSKPAFVEVTPPTVGTAGTIEICLPLLREDAREDRRGDELANRAYPRQVRADRARADQVRL